jgi:hypothetical protein
MTVVQYRHAPIVSALRRIYLERAAPHLSRARCAATRAALDIGIGVAARCLFRIGGGVKLPGTDILGRLGGGCFALFDFLSRLGFGPFAGSGFAHCFLPFQKGFRWQPNTVDD